MTTRRDVFGMLAGAVVAPLVPITEIKQTGLYIVTPPPREAMSHDYTEALRQAFEKHFEDLESRWFMTTYSARGVRVEEIQRKAIFLPPDGA